MASLTPELIEKAKTAKSAEELRLLAKENGIQKTGCLNFCHRRG